MLFHLGRAFIDTTKHHPQGAQNERHHPDPRHPERHLGFLRHDERAGRSRLAAGHDRHLGRHQPALESVRTFLDSRHGRHFADDVQNGIYAGATLADAIAQATQRWMGWTIGRQTAKQYDIPKGLPYLTGFVIHCEITELSIEESLAA